MTMKKKWLFPILAAFTMFSTTPKDQAEAADISELKAATNKYIDTPYVYGGTSINGIDCSGFTSKVYADLGIKINRTSGAQYQQGEAIAKSDLQVGDLLFFNTSGRGVSHVAIYMGDNKMVHSQSYFGVSYSSLDERYWKSRYIGAKRITNFEDEGALDKAVAQVKQEAIDLTIYASREEVAKQLAITLNLDITNKDTGFTDVKPSHRSAGHIAAMKKAGIFSGDENGKFNPSSPLTRAQLAKILVAAFDLEKGDKLVEFKDVAKDHPAAEEIDILASQNVLSGKLDGTFGLHDKVTLVQLEKLIERAKNSSEIVEN